MKKNLMNVIRFLEAVVADMHENNRKEIKCSCRKCKEQVWIDPFKGGHLKAHLVMHGFMNGYTRWISEDDFEDAGHGEDVVMKKMPDYMEKMSYMKKMSYMEKMS